MHYKQILVYLDHGVANKARVNTAISIATAQGASLTGIVVSALPMSGLLERFRFSNPVAALEAARKEADAIFGNFTVLCEEAGVTSDTRLLECREGRAGEKLARIARLYDLSIIRQADPHQAGAAHVSAMSEEVMLSSGRPAICVPYIGAHLVPFKTGLIAWDGSRASTRAVHDALPLLEQIEKVIILIVSPEKFENFSDHQPGDGLAAHLASHGIETRVERVPVGEVSTSTVILNELSDTGADILIMGGFGTSRLREIVLGGVTRTLFECMTAPVFMSH
jgi:nucleotide-binding universal stress UspA family protein